MIPFKLAAVLCLVSLRAMAGESKLTTTYQPLDGLGSGGILVVPVTCHHWFSGSVGSAVDLISAANVPPTDNPEQAKEDLNLASVCGLDFSTHDLGAGNVPRHLAMDATAFKVPPRFGQPREDVIRACLECLRRCLPAVLRETPLTLKCADEDREWLGKIVAEFNEHDRAEPFFKGQG